MSTPPTNGTHSTNPTNPTNPHRFAQAVEYTTATYDRVAKNYAERNEEMPAHWAERMQAFVALLDDAEDVRPIPNYGRPGDEISLEEYLHFVPVLDAGCGTGRDARTLAGQGEHGLPVLGVDLSQGMLDEAGERTARRLPKGSVRYALMDLRRLDLPDGSCRGVWCSASLLHIPRASAPRALAELARVTRRGGPLALFVRAPLPAEEGGSGVAEEFIPYEHLTEQNDGTALRRYYAYYTPDELRALAEDAGLTVLDVATFTFAPAPDRTRHSWVSLLARKG